MTIWTCVSSDHDKPLFTTGSWLRMWTMTLSLLLGSDTARPLDTAVRARHGHTTRGYPRLFSGGRHI